LRESGVIQAGEPTKGGDEGVGLERGPFPLAEHSPDDGVEKTESEIADMMM
jgi:hypothetical protein